jgi:bifunctional non-homologous end joining protein LigD
MGVARSGRVRSRDSAIAPMLATAASSKPAGSGWTFEPKFDGVRVLAFSDGSTTALVSRNGIDKSAQFPEIVEEIDRLVGRRGSIVLDGEIVALDDGKPARFQKLQSRMHALRGIDALRHSTPAALIAFDCLLSSDETLVAEPWTARRKRLEKLLSGFRSEYLRLGDTSADSEAVFREAAANGWEGVIAKRVDAAYRPGVRSRDWIKLKLERRQEFVVGGYTDPRGSRMHIGALLVGYFGSDRLIYAGHVGGGFSRASLADMRRRLWPLRSSECPFSPAPRTNQKAHWVEPRVVVEVRFNEWTSDGRLRQPIFLGVRDDKDPEEIVREPSHVVEASMTRPVAKSASSSRKKRASSDGSTRAKSRASSDIETVVRQLDEIQAGRGEGTLQLPDGNSLDVTSLGKVFFPDIGVTKGDLMRYYTRVSPALLPAIADHPLVLKRYPNGIRGQTFYQQKAPDKLPAAVRAEPAADDGELRFIGGSLATLLYIVQIGAISIDPWHSRVGTLEYPDYTIVDLDPGAGTKFQKVIDAALLVRDELSELGLNGIAKTSGASGMHVVIPLPPRTDEDTARLLAELVATNVATKAPKIATVVRSVKSRPKGTVYADYLQNIRGKSVAGVYSVRAQPGATVSTPLDWEEVAPGLDPRDYTMDVVVERLATIGDLWARAMKRSNSLETLTNDPPKRPQGRARKSPASRK